MSAADELDSYLRGARPGEQELSVMVPVHVVARAVAALRSVPVVTDEMVEAGALALFDFDWRGEKSWLDVDRGVRVQYERRTRAALAAALPVPPASTTTEEE